MGLNLDGIEKLRWEKFLMNKFKVTDTSQYSILSKTIT